MQPVGYLLRLEGRGVTLSRNPPGTPQADNITGCLSTQDSERILPEPLFSVTFITGGSTANYPPAYAFDYQDGPYVNTLNRLSLQRPIPTLDRGGLLPAQKHAAAALVQRLKKHSDALLVGEMGTGKAQSLDSKVLTPSGWKRMGNVRVGDEVVNPEGGTACVIGVFPQGKKDIYRVTFSDGAQTECCDEHLWQVTTPERKWRGQAAQVFELQQIRSKLFSKSGNARYFVPIVEPVDFYEQPLPLDPYLLGVLIGDGALSTAVSCFPHQTMRSLSLLMKPYQKE